MQDHCSRSPYGDGRIPAARTPRGVVVSAEVRDAIHPELTVALIRVGDIAIAQDRGEHLDAAGRARCGCPDFPVTMPAEQLALALLWLHQTPGQAVPAARQLLGAVALEIVHGVVAWAA
jgi:hypothetical protein